MSAEIVFHAGLLFASATLAIWAFVVVRRRPEAPGRGALGALLLAVAHWCLTSGLHALVESVDTRIALSQLQYVGIAAVPPLWLLFASQYARLSWTADPVLRVVLWIVPAATIALALTNGAHGLIWSAVVPVSGPSGQRLEYVHGLWFWVAVAFNYFCLAAGTVALVRALRRSPITSGTQLALVIAGVTLPWAGNILYLSRVIPAGIDPTPVAFALSGTCILWSLYRHRLLTLVPIARDLVVESLDAGVLVLDPRRIIVDMNPAARRLMGTTEHAIGQSIETIVPWWRTASASGRLAPGAPLVIDVGRVSLEVQMTPIADSQGKAAGSVLVIRDVSERRAAEEARRAIERRLQERQRVESLGVLTAGVAHDFNNVLAGILGNAELVSLEAPADSDVSARARAIVRGVQHAADLVDKLLAYAGKRQAAPEAIDLDALVRDTGGLLQTAFGRDYTINFEGSRPLPPVNGDPAHLRQLVLNLVTNAAEASTIGSTISVTTGSETLSKSAIAAMTFDGCLSPGESVFVEVADRGTGIDEATLARIFDPFFSTKENGRGLGLAAVQGIVRSHGGAIQITSAPGHGTRVKVWLPAGAVRAAG